MSYESGWAVIGSTMLFTGGLMENKEYTVLTIPTVSWDKKVLSGTYGELVAQPLEPGLGITFGNAIRRVLLSSIEGAAVTSIIVKGINNEFTAITGVVEDAMQLVLNIKQIVVRSKDGKPGKMHLHINGSAVAKVADIKADENLELINLDHVVATVADGHQLDIEFFVETGRGYVPAQWPAEKAYQDDNRIYLDAMFSPIKKVMLDVTKTRVGNNIDYDRLVVKVYTNGAENPVDAVHYAVSVIRTQLEHFEVGAEIPFNNLAKKNDEPEVEDTAPTNTLGLTKAQVVLLLKPIDDLELSVRAHNCLINAGIKRVIDLVNKSEDEVLNIKNFGRKSLEELKENIRVLGLSFGMNIHEDSLKNSF